MVRPKKHLGQHFLRDENIARKIAGFLPGNSQLVLEVGPGTGILSRYLLEIPGIDPWFMEVDSESVDYLKVHYPDYQDRFLLQDFLEYDFSVFPPRNLSETDSKPAHSEPFILVGNFPYNISSQILFKALENRDRIPQVVGMFQKEMAERVASPHGNKVYGIISVLVQAFYEVEYLFTVSENVFYPPPKVKSAVIRLRRNSTVKLDCDEKLFIRVVKTAFNQRRKTLRNSLSSVHGIGQISASLLAKRAEQLSVSDFISLAREIATFA